MADSPIDISTFFETKQFDLETFERFADATHVSAVEREKFDSAVSAYVENASGAEGALRAAIGFLLLSRFQEALEWFSKAGTTAARYYFQARAECGVDRMAEAIESFQQAESKGWDAFDCQMKIAALHVRMGDLKSAAAIHKKHQSVGMDRAEWYFVAGLLAENEDRVEALDNYERSLTLNPEHHGAAFYAAWLYDLRGEDDRAIALYERLARHPRAHVNALINLSVVYEDRGRFDLAVGCLRRVLAAFPNHARARLFLKDVESSRGMVIDDSHERRSERRTKLLDTPISEFELSVRARNCLKKMNVATLGDLLRLTEEELLSFKNFGDTSLNEIKVLLGKKGMHLGQRPDEVEVTEEQEPAPVAPPVPRVIIPPGAEAALAKPVSELELSVRARRCLQRLSVSTIGDLLRHSEAELMAVRNFGQTSLIEIKQRLADLGLSLAPKA